MPAVPLPENPSLEHLKNQAKLVQDLVRSGDGGAVDLVDEFHPSIDRADQESLRRFKRSDAQVVIARLYGFASWASLRAHLALLEDYARPDPADRDAADGGGDGEGDGAGGESDRAGSVDRFVSLACVSYSPVDVIGRLDAAQQLLDADPSLAEAGIAAMMVTGNHGLVARWLADNRADVDRPCGPNRWPPILYGAYSRVVGAGDEFSIVEAVRLLLGAGADPNAGFLWRGLVPPFTALTGAFGGGEIDQPAHRDREALARLLLDAGADPNDGQALYNNGLAGSPMDDPSHLELLVEYGLGTETAGPWYERFGSQLTEPEALLYDELEIAAHRGLPQRMRFLVELSRDRGLDIDRPVGRSQLTPAALAKQAGHDEILQLLAEAGVDVGPAPGGGDGI